jgi:hypothetical protein
LDVCRWSAMSASYHLITRWCRREQSDKIEYTTLKGQLQSYKKWRMTKLEEQLKRHNSYDKKHTIWPYPEIQSCCLFMIPVFMIKLISSCPLTAKLHGVNFLSFGPTTSNFKQRALEMSRRVEEIYFLLIISHMTRVFNHRHWTANISFYFFLASSGSAALNIFGIVTTASWASNTFNHANTQWDFLNPFASPVSKVK